MKNYLEKLLAARKAKLADLQARNAKSENVDELRSLGAEIVEVSEEVRSLEAKLASLDEEKEERGFDPAQVVGAAKMNVVEERKAEDPKATMEYREAFMNYVLNGTRSEVLQYEKRNDDSGVASNLGVLIPMTVIQSIMTGVEKVYGQLYSRVKKLNVKGGVKFPIGSFSATFNRISENGKSDRQNAGGVTGYVEFSYNIGEIRIARSLLQTVLTVPAFEEKFAEVIVKAYVKAMDKEIMVGGDSTLFPTEYTKQCTGILTEAAKASSRIASGNIIEFTAADMADWKKWQEKLFAKIPLSMRALKPQFVMTANTFESNIKTLHDDNNRPLGAETFNPVDGAEICKFAGKEVVLVENDILEDFNDATNGEYFGMYWIPEEAYAINTNMEFIVREYFDEELNQFVKKALVINDGKILDPKYIYLLKKKVEA